MKFGSLLKKDPIAGGIVLTSTLALILAAVHMVRPIPAFFTNTTAWILFGGSLGLLLVNLMVVYKSVLGRNKLTFPIVALTLLGGLGVTVAVYMMLGDVPTWLKSTGIVMLVATAISGLIDWTN